MASLTEQIAQLEAAIAAQEGLRPLLGDAVVGAIIAAARAQLVTLRAQPLESAAAQDSAGLLARRLDTLLAAGLIRLAQPPPELEYLFRHSLLQEATYGSMLNSQRQAFHQQIGRVMEQLFAHGLDQRAATLAFHFDAAGDAARALRYYTLAGDHAFRQFANAEAVVHYGRALTLARRSASSAEQQAHLGLRLGRAYELTNDYPRALVTYTSMQQWAAEPRDASGLPPGDTQPLRLAGLLAEAIAYGTPSDVHDPVRAVTLSHEALALARELGNPAAEARTLWNLMQVGFWTGGDTQQALASGRESLAIARRHDLREQMGFTLVNLAGVYWGLGQFAEAQAMIDEARGLWQSLNNASMLGDAYNMGAWTSFFRGQLTDVLAGASQGLEISRRIGNHWNQAGARQVEGNAYFHLGRFPEAVQSLQAAVEHCRLAHISAADTLSCLADTYAALGDHTRAREVIAQALRELDTLASNFHPLTLGSLARAQLTLGAVHAAEEILQLETPASPAEELTVLGSPYRLAQAELAVAQARPSEALGILDTLIPFLVETGLVLFLYEARFVRGQALLAQGEWAQAAQALGEARTLAEAMGVRRLLWQIYAALADAEQERDQRAEAESLRGMARAELLFLAGRAAEWKDAFLTLPAVRRVLPQAGSEAEIWGNTA